MLPTALRLGLLFAAAAPCVGHGLGAQEPAPAEPRVARAGAPAKVPAVAPRAVLENYSAAASRAAFAACDANGDDRLSVLEVERTIENLGGQRLVESFRRLDGSRDGYLDWREFDRAFQEATRQGGSLRLVPARPLTLVPEVVPVSPARREAEQLLTTLDGDGSGSVDAAELKTLLDRHGLAVAPDAVLTALDRDADRVLSLAEITELCRLMPGIATTRTTDLSAHVALPERFRACDRNLDGTLDRDELVRALRRLDSGLARWAAKILADADRNANQSLSPTEVQPGVAEPVEVPRVRNR